MDTLKTVEKALKILKILTAQHEGKGTAELSAEINVSMPTASRLLSTLRQHSFVQRHPITKKNMLGKAALDIGRSFYQHIGYQLLSVAKPEIMALRDKVGESVLLEAMMGDEVVLIYRANGPNMIGILAKVGTRVPLHASPGAKAILAYYPESAINSIYKEDLTQFTSKTITNLEVLKENFTKIRKDGVAFSYGEYYPDMNGLAVPVFSDGKLPLAAIVIPVPAYRATSQQEKKIVPLLKESAKNISDKLANYGTKGQLRF